jgi:hypothetical protein
MIRAIEVRAHARIDRAAALSTDNPRNGIERGDRLRPACQAWGGPRALNGRRSNGLGSLAANDHGNISVNKRGLRIIARIGRISVPARLILAQMAQKSPARPVGFFCGGDGERSAAASPTSVADQAVEPTPNWPAWTWPNDSTSWQASAKNANQTTTPRFDRNQPMAAGKNLSDRGILSNWTAL